MPFGGRENALTYIAGLIDEGMINTHIVNFLKEQGFGYNTQRMFEDVNRIRLENFGASFVPHLGLDVPIPERFMRTWEGKTDYNYRAVVKFEYLEAETGLEKTAGTTFYSDTGFTQGEVSELWEVRKENLGQSPPGVEEVFGAISVQYFKNVLPRGAK